MRAMILITTLVLATATIVAQADRPMARAEIQDAEGQSLGHADFAETAHGVRVTLWLTKAPQGIHAVHIHGTGACDPPSFKSAGDHFNPGSTQHGFDNPRGVHAGDLPNLHVPSGGDLVVDMFVHRATLKEGQTSLFDRDGATIVIHEGADDYVSDPAGESGARLGCGVIQRHTS